MALEDNNGKSKSLREYSDSQGARHLIEAIESRNLFHAYIVNCSYKVFQNGFSKAFMKAVLCNEDKGGGCGVCRSCLKIDHGNYLDAYHVAPEDGKQSIGVGAIQKLVEDVKRVTIDGDYKFLVIHRGDILTEDAQNALLKTLEEPGKNTVIIIQCENLDNLLITIKSRCQVVLLGVEYSVDKSLENLADEIFSMVRERGFFYKIKEKLDKKISSRDEALDFLDALEVLVGQRLRKDSLALIEREIDAIEEARRHIMESINYKYALRVMVLKMGG